MRSGCLNSYEFGEVTAIELVNQAVQEIERLNPKLNAVTARLYDQSQTAAVIFPRKSGRV